MKDEPKTFLVRGDLRQRRIRKNGERLLRKFQRRAHLRL